MKNITLAICMAAASGAATADTILGFDASLGVWIPSYDGGIGRDDFAIESFNPAEDNITFIQAALEHPVPLIPNVMVAHSSIETNGDTTLSETARFGDLYFPADSTVGMNLDLSYTDATFYYELLDNWVNLDLGLTARRYDGQLDVASDLQTETVELAGYLPMLYGMARFDLPFTGWSTIAQGNGTGYKGGSVTDLTAKVRWDFAPVLDLGLEAGYRTMNMNLKRIDELGTDLDISGAYIGLNLHL
ncbi:TIGR04219 family outer membrane beta-barrel protein [Microbulbifer discodermiae]|uniref:TIGR04219 family outer membrane beta-barrel protein n=1 Tax=Microbulbifer sp. 2201CG32-9 TaxID=3232309 RepID=UPI00345B7FCD